MLVILNILFSSISSRFRGKSKSIYFFNFPKILIFSKYLKILNLFLNYLFFWNVFDFWKYFKIFQKYFKSIQKYFNFFFKIFQNIFKYFIFLKNIWGVVVVDKACDPKFPSVLLYLYSILNNKDFEIWWEFWKFQKLSFFKFSKMYCNYQWQCMWFQICFALSLTFLHKNVKIGNFFKISNPWPWKIEP